MVSKCARVILQGAWAYWPYDGGVGWPTQASAFSGRWGSTCCRCPDEAVVEGNDHQVMLSKVRRHARDTK